jgi:hypothetical protein
VKFLASHSPLSHATFLLHNGEEKIRHSWDNDPKPENFPNTISGIRAQNLCENRQFLEVGDTVLTSLRKQSVPYPWFKYSATKKPGRIFQSKTFYSKNGSL